MCVDAPTLRACMHSRTKSEELLEGLKKHDVIAQSNDGFHEGWNALHLARAAAASERSCTAL